MPITEIVRLKLEVTGGAQANRTLRLTKNLLDALKSTYAGSDAAAQQFSAQTSAALSGLNANVQKASQGFKQAAGGLFLPQNLATQTKKTAQGVQQGAQQITQAAQQASGQIKNVSDVTKRSNLVLIDTGRLVQDLAFGIRAGVNNLDPLILNFLRLRQSAAPAGQAVASVGQSLKALFAGLSGAAGLLLLINLLFTIGTLTGVFDPITKAIEDLFAATEKAALGMKEYTERVKEAAKESLKFSEALQLTDAINSLDALNSEMDRLTSLRRAQTLTDIFTKLTAILLAPLGGAPINELSAGLREENERITAQLERLAQLGAAYQSGTEAFDKAAQSALLADPDFVLARQLEIQELISKTEGEIRTLRRESAETGVRTLQEIARREGAGRIAELQRQQRTLLGEARAFELRRAQVAEEASGEVNDLRREELAQALATYNTLADRLRQAASRINAQILEESRRTQAQMQQIALEARRGITQELADAANQAERLEVAAISDETERRIRQIEVATKQQIEALNEELARSKAVGAERELLEALFQEQRTALRAAADREIADLRRAELEAEQGHTEALLRLIEDLSVVRGEEQVEVLRSRAERARSRLEEARSEKDRVAAATAFLQALIAVETEEKRIAAEKEQRLEREAELRRRLRTESGGDETTQIRQRIAALDAEIRARRESGEAVETQIEERLRLLIVLRSAEADATRARLQGIKEQLEAERELTDARRDFETELARLSGEGDRTAFSNRLAVLARELAATRAASDDILRLQDAIAAKSQEIALIDEGEPEKIGRARAQLAALQEELVRVEAGSGDVVRLQDEIYRTTLDLIEAERRLWEARIGFIESFVTRAAQGLFDAALVQQEISDLEVQATRERLALQEEQLEASLRRREISHEEYQQRLKDIALDRSEFEKRLDEDRASFFERTGDVLVDAAKATAKELIAEAISLAARLVVQSIIAQRIVERSTTAAMLQIGVAAGPAAAAVSIATLGGAAGIGGAAAASAITFVSALVRRLQGFEKGGFTGRGQRSEPAGIVHRGEFVFTKAQVGGNPAPFYALASAINKGLLPRALFDFLRGAGFRTTDRRLMGIAGLPYQTGGFVDAQGLLAPAPVSNSEETVRELKALRAQVSALTQAVEAQDQRYEVVLPRETTRQIGRAIDADRTRFRVE